MTGHEKHTKEQREHKNQRPTISRLFDISREPETEGVLGEGFG